MMVKSMIPQSNSWIVGNGNYAEDGTSLFLTLSTSTPLIITELFQMDRFSRAFLDYTLWCPTSDGTWINSPLRRKPFKDRKFFAGFTELPSNIQGKLVTFLNSAISSFYFNRYLVLSVFLLFIGNHHSLHNWAVHWNRSAVSFQEHTIQCIPKIKREWKSKVEEVNTPVSHCCSPPLMFQ